MKTKRIVKALFSVSLILILVLSLTGCSLTNRPEKYKSYVESLLTANYLGIEDDYLKATGANEADAEALHLENATRLAENLISYYGLDFSNDSNLGPQMVEIAKNIYGKAKFEVSEGYADGDDYYVDVTIYPINILSQTYDATVDYIEDFNVRVKNGAYNNYDRIDYENEYAAGIVSILQSAVPTCEYAEPITITVSIIASKDLYYIDDNDFKTIDSHIIAVPDHTDGIKEEVTE